MLFTACLPNYSTGTRVGVVTKLSKSGVVFKSWEGDLLMALPGDISAVNAEKFQFSVADEAVKDVEDAMRSGKRVELQYHQWLVSPPTISTHYVITAVKVLQ
jgi:hypothetical protein